MGRFVVVDQDNFEVHPGQEMDPNDIVERDGYADTQTIVTELMLAGELYDEQKRLRYQYPNDSAIKIEDMELDPVVDEINVFPLAKGVAERAVEAKKKEKEKKDEEIIKVKEKEREALKEELRKEIKDESAG